ncbi:Holliday junction resolvase RuvX [Bifidobacterium thermophilum]|uniref:Holliday junction resolvase RuvX n=1 Tax=Bifidobacterium thermophilum TaxID=33905 RepID=UPI00309ABF4C
MVWLGVDLGAARVGLALSDPELTFAHPIGNIRVHGDAMEAVDDVIDIIEREHVDHVVVGMPLLLSGNTGQSAKKARRWVHELIARMIEYRDTGQLHISDIPLVELHDERLTTVTAHRQLCDVRITARGHRPMVDQQSAVLILQSALDTARTEDAARAEGGRHDEAQPDKAGERNGHGR